MSPGGARLLASGALSLLSATVRSETAFPTPYPTSRENQLNLGYVSRKGGHGEGMGMRRLAEELGRS